jgi:DNA-binding response OmpR family regulator
MAAEHEPRGNATMTTGTAAEMDMDHGSAVAAEIRRPRVLVVEDDFELRRLLVWVLSREGYDVVEARDGTEALSCFLNSGLPDLVLSDVCVPGRSGFEVLASARRMCPSVPVILITAFGSAETHAEARRLGAAAVFDKPLVLEDLRWTIRGLLT